MDHNENMETRRFENRDQTDMSSIIAEMVTATQYGVYEKCVEFLNDGFDVNQRDSENISLLHWASINNRRDLVQLFIERGAIVDAIGGQLSSTPLHWATHQGHLTIVVVLISHGADPTIRDVEGYTAIHLAAQFGFTPIVAFLLAKGVSPDIQDKNGLTPLMWAACRVHSVDPARLLMTFGASTSISDSVHHNTAPHWALLSKNYATLNLMSNRNARFDIPNDSGDTVITLLHKLKAYDWITKKNINAILAKYDHVDGSFLRKIKKDNKIRFWGTAAIPFVMIFALGSVFDAALSPLYKAAVLTLLYLAFRFIGNIVCDERFFSIFPISLYLATKLWMYLVWFSFISPVLPISYTLLMVSLSSLLWYNFLKAWRGDPGVIKISYEERIQTIFELAELNQLDAKTFCTTCLVRRPYRSKHCSVCDRCVARFDHHCPWLSNCVGWKNHKYFIGYLFFLIIMCLVYFWGSYLYATTKCHHHKAILSIFFCESWVTFMAAQAVVHASWVSVLLFCQLYQILWLGVTTDERLKMGRYPHVSGPNLRRSSRSVFKNFVNFFEIPIAQLDTTDWKRAWFISPNYDEMLTQSDTRPLIRDHRDNFQFV